MSFTGFSQNLTPKVEISNVDTLFCFTLPHAKVIASELVYGQYMDSVAKALEEKSCLQEEIILAKDSIILSQHSTIANYTSLQKTYESEITSLSEALSYEQKKAKRYKRLSWLMGIGMAALAVTAAAK